MTDKATSITSYAASVGGISWGVWTTNDLLTALSVACALGTLAVNWYYKRQDNQRKAELHALTVKKLEGQG